MTSQGEYLDLSDIITVDFPILSFEDSLSECLPESMTMDSLTLYSFDSGEKAHQKAAQTDFLLADDSVPGLADLDPNSELSFDLQQLIENSNHNDNVGEQLFPELLSTCPDLLKADVTAEVGEESELSNIDTSNNVDLLGEEHMPQSVIRFELPTDEAGQPLFIIKPEPELVSGEEGSVFSQSESVEGLPTEPPAVNRGRPRSSLKATPPSKVKTTSRRKTFEKDSEEYRERRAKNNVAVRKSRDKAKIKQEQTNSKLQELTNRNEALQKKVDLLSKELNVLKGLFQNVGAELPKVLQKDM